eukprot:jgi/Hompol1/6045/HPOL_004823-RA
MNAFAQSGRLDLAQWLHARVGGGYSVEALIQATRYRRIPLIKFLMETGGLMVTPAVMRCASVSVCVYWFKEHYDRIDWKQLRLETTDQEVVDCKWDRIELSDDEDFECHPNVDKKSMIRWKQSQVHKERRERQDQSDLLRLEHETTARFLRDFPHEAEAALAAVAAGETNKSENETNDGTQDAGALLVAALDGLQAKVEAQYTEPIRSESMRRINAWPREWEAPDWGPVLPTHRPWHDAIAAVRDQAAAHVAAAAESHSPLDLSAEIQAAKTMIDETLGQFAARQSAIAAQLTVLDNLMNKKLTIDHLKTGFDKTIITKTANDETMTTAPAADASASAATTAKSEKTIETIHTPKATKTPSAADEIAEYPGLADEILAEFNSSDADLAEIHPDLVPYSEYTDFDDVVKSLKKHPKFQTESVEEALLMRALSLEIVGRAAEAKTCVINSMIIKFTRSLGESGIDMFFTRLYSGGQSAHALFDADVSKTYEHIQKRGKIIRAERIADRQKAIKERQEHEAKLKAIYNTFLQEDGSLVFPLPESPSESQLERAKWFSELPRYAQEGLLLEDVEKINQFLSTLNPDEAERNARFAIECGFINVEEEDGGAADGDDEADEDAQDDGENDVE